MKGLLTLLMLAAVAAAAWYLPASSRHHYSETGVLYTTNYLTLQLPTGVIGFPPGTRLTSRFNVHVPDEETVTDGKYTLAVDPQTLTHDIEYAADLREADQLNQDQSQARIAQIKADHAASQHAVELTHAQDIDGVNATMVASSTVGNYNTRLHDSTVPVGAWGGYGSYGASFSGVPSGGVTNTVNNVTVYTAGRSTGSTMTSPVTAGYYAKVVPGNSSLSPRPVVGAPMALANTTAATAVAH